MKKLNPFLLLALVSAVFFLPALGSVHLFDWDEINFAESAREMLVSGDYSGVQVNFRPFWEKPPLFIWMQALSMKVFGVNEFAARFPNAVAGFLSLSFIFFYGKKHFGTRMGWLWVLAMLGSFTPQLYFKSGIIDPFFNLFIFAGIVMLAEGANLDKRPRKKFNALAGFFIGLALLTKGPVALLVAMLCVALYFVYRGFRFFFDIWDILLFALTCAAVSFVWYGMEVMENGIWFLAEFLRYQKELASQSVASHGQPWFYHPLVLLFGAFPASVIALRSFAENLTWTQEQKNFRTWMAVLFWVVLILFSIVKTKIIHYSSLCYLPLTFLAALVMDATIQQRIQYRRFNVYLVLIIGLMMSLAFIGIPLIGIVPEWKASLIAQLKDPFAAANFGLESIWDFKSILPGSILLIGTITAFVLLFRRNLEKAYPVLFIIGLLALQGFMLWVVPGIEHHSQGPAIEFIESHQDEDVYVEVLGYKSYAQLFYSQIAPLSDTVSYNAYVAAHPNDYQNMASRDIPALLYRDWLMYGDIDKPAYFLSKIQHKAEFSAIPTLEVIGEKGGFVFYRRKP